MTRSGLPEALARLRAGQPSVLVDLADASQPVADAQRLIDATREADLPVPVLVLPLDHPELRHWLHCGLPRRAVRIPPDFYQALKLDAPWPTEDLTAQSCWALTLPHLAGRLGPGLLALA